MAFAMRYASSIAVHILVLAICCAVTPAQQTGTAVGVKPGTAIGRSITVTRAPLPVPTCAPVAASSEQDPSAPGVPSFAFSRQDLVCLHRSDGRDDNLAKGLPWDSASVSHSDVAYWLADKHELHLLSLQDHSDRILDTIPNAIMRGLIWSSAGRVLSYLPAGAQPPGFRAMDLDSEQRMTFPGSFVELVPSPDPKYVAAVSSNGVVRFRLSDGKQETVAAAEFPGQASYSRSGAYLGVTVASFTAAESAAEATGQSSPAAVDDDSPDCTGGAFALLIKRANTDQMARLPFPKGFDTVLDFAFSPDDRAIAVTFGVTGCDYPGELARIYKVSLPDLTLTPISPVDRLSVEPHWSPDANTILYTDYTGNDSPLVAFDLRSGKTTRLTSPGQFGPDRFLAWH